MTQPTDPPRYVLDSADEMQRLERQARIYGTADDLRLLAPQPGEQILDVGCGAGSFTRAIAQGQPAAQVRGLDREPRYLAHARAAAAEAGLAALAFDPGDATALPYADGRFDAVFARNLLQWVPQRERALAEFVRVLKPGGRLLCCNFDGFMLRHEPVDERLRADLLRWLAAARERLGFDADLGPRLPPMFKAAGLAQVTVQVSPDRAFSGFGGDAERLWNWQVQALASMPFFESVFGGAAAAQAFTQRLMHRLADERTYFACVMYAVMGRKPG